MSSILTVSQVNTYISFKLKNDPKLHGIAIKGEISNLSVNQRSGHMFFSLRDQGAVIKAVMFASNAAKLRFAPFDGMSVVAYGSIEVYERDGVYQIIVTQLAPDGAGNAYMALLKLKEKLQSLGVFDAPKRPIPRYPEKIAVVTSPTGAAVQDVKNIVIRRYPIAELEVFPTAVQGLDAPSSIANALYKADQSGADVIILTRGGGSAEDLSAFNTEVVAMAVYNCKTPVISAVGHEIDWTLCDLTADLRAPTPSGAAELATPDITEMRSTVQSMRSMLNHYAAAKVKSFRDNLNRYEYALSSLSVKGKIESRKSELEALKDSFERQTRHRLEVSRINLNGLCEMLKSLDPNNVISRGYALVYKDGDLTADASKLRVGDGISIVMRDGSADAEVKRIIGDNDEI